MTVEYKCVNKYIRDGFMNYAEGKVVEVVQPMLDEGVTAGWRLHSFSSNDVAKGVNLTFIWERELFEPKAV